MQQTNTDHLQIPPKSARHFRSSCLTVGILGLTVLGASAHEGVTPSLTYISEVFRNHSGGISSGSAWAGLLDIGIELDLEELAGWQGATFFANTLYFYGNDVSGERVGDFNAITNLYTDTSFNFYKIFLQQSFGSGDSFFKLGQIALDDDFMVSESALPFLNASFGPLPIQSGNTAAPVYALAAPGAMINYEPETGWFARAAFYGGDSGPVVSGNQGFGWNTGGASGWMLMAEGGFKYGEEDASVFKVGGYYHTGDFERFSNGGIESGLHSFYAVLDHRLIAPNGCPGLNVFVRGGITPEGDLAVVSSYAEAGLVASGVCRDDDSLGFGASWTELSDGFVNAEGGTSSETVLELTYQVSLSEWCVLQPDLQYIIDPQGGGDDAFLTGLRVGISF